MTELAYLHLNICRDILGNQKSIAFSIFVGIFCHGFAVLEFANYGVSNLNFSAANNFWYGIELNCIRFTMIFSFLSSDYRKMVQEQYFGEKTSESWYAESPSLIPYQHVCFFWQNFSTKLQRKSNMIQNLIAVASINVHSISNPTWNLYHVTQETHGICMNLSFHKYVCDITLVIASKIKSIEEVNFLSQTKKGCSYSSW